MSGSLSTVHCYNVRTPDTPTINQPVPLQILIAYTFEQMNTARVHGMAPAPRYYNLMCHATSHTVCRAEDT